MWERWQKIITSGKNEYPYEGKAIMTWGDLVVITPVPDDLLVNKTGAVLDALTVVLISKEKGIKPT